MQVELSSNGGTNDDAAKSTVVAAQLRPGSFFGEGSAMTGAPRAATVRAITPVEVVHLTSDDLALLQPSTTSSAYIQQLSKERSLVRIRVLLKNAHCPEVRLTASGDLLFSE